MKIQNKKYQVYVKFRDNYEQVEVLGLRSSEFLVKRENGEVLAVNKSEIFIPVDFTYSHYNNIIAA